MLLAGNGLLCQQPASDRTSRVKALVAVGRFEDAKDVVEEWIKADPRDLDARAWHARLLAWTNHWKEAETEYRELLSRSPEDVDVLAGLADVLSWQDRREEALALLEHACGLDPDRTDCRLRRARVLQQLGRTREALVAYREILAKDGTSAEARRGLKQLREAGRHELRLDAGLDLFNYAENAGAMGVSFRSRWNNRWSSLASVTQYYRFGEPATRAAADATLHLSSTDALTLGGAGSRDRGIVPRAEAQFEYGHGFHLREGAPIGGVETLYQQRWLWYRDAHILVLSPGAIFYLPKDWDWLFRFSMSRIGISGSQHDWKPSGWTRLTFPLKPGVRGHLMFATGTENFGLIDQIAQSPTHTWGAGMQFRVAPGQELSGYGRYQTRAQGQTQASFGVSYAVRY
jgi:tetratricopeptide (TPR) repeat protein